MWWMLYCAATPAGVGGTEIVTGNRIAKTYWPTGSGDHSAGGGYYGPAAYCGPPGVDVWAGNVWDDTGAAIPR